MTRFLVAILASSLAESALRRLSRTLHSVTEVLTQVMYVSRTDLKPPCFYAAHMLLQIDLSGNQIGGYRAGLQMVSTPEGPKAIADAPREGLTAMESAMALMPSAL